MVFNDDPEVEVTKIETGDANANGDVEESVPFNVQQEESEIARN